MGTRDLTHKAIAEALSNDRLLTHDQRAALLTLVADDSVWQRKHDEAQAEVALLRAAMNGGNVIERLQFALQRLADAAEALGVNHFGEDWRSDEVQELQAATHAARLVLGPNVAFSGVPAGHSSNHPAGGTSACNAGFGLTGAEAEGR